MAEHVDLINQWPKAFINNKETDPNVPGSYQFSPIGYIRSMFKDKNGTPRQSGICTETAARLEIDSNLFNNPDHTIDGLENFSHIWLLFVFHKNNNRYTKAKVRPPRLNGKSQGVFATRSPYRFNPVGLTLAQIIKIEGHVIYLSGVDVIDGTPVIDIKPYIEEYDNPKMHRLSELLEKDLIKVNHELNDDSKVDIHLDRIGHSVKSGDENKIFKSQKFEIKEAAWIKSADANLHLNVRFTPTAENQLSNLRRFQSHSEGLEKKHSFLNKLEEFKGSVYQILSADPRSSYRRNKCQDRLYFLVVDFVKLTCWFDEDTNTVEVLKVNEEMTSPNIL